MSHLPAEELIKILHQKANLYRITGAGPSFTWFSTEIPAGLPVGTERQHIVTQDVPLPYGHFSTTSGSLAAWMSYWHHVGPRIIEATAFVSVSPARQSKPVAIIEWLEPLAIEEKASSEYRYQFEPDIVDWFHKGLIDGLATAPTHPLADVKIQVLGVIWHVVNSSPKAFEILGQRLMEAVVTEMYKRDWIQTGTKG